MNFIRNEHTLDSNGFVIRALKNKDKEYGLIQPFSEQPTHKIAFLKYFLFYDGAILISLLKKIFEEGEIEAHNFAPNDPEIDKGEWNDVMSNMFKEYENSSISREDKLSFKTIKKNSKKTQYSYEYVRQLFPPRVGALSDFGIIDYSSANEGSKRLVYYKRIDKGELTKKFLDIFPNVESLDESFANDGDFFERISKFYFPNLKNNESSSNSDLLQEHVLSAYETVAPMNNGIVPLDTIRDIICIKCLLGIKPSETELRLPETNNKKIICEVRHVNEAIEKLVLNNPSADILNDRKGRPTYLSLN